MPHLSDTRPTESAPERSAAPSMAATVALPPATAPRQHGLIDRLRELLLRVLPRGMSLGPDKDIDGKDDDEPTLNDARLLDGIGGDAVDRDPVSPALAGLLPDIWGAGFTQPGGAEFTLYLSQPLALTPDINLLDLNAGLGGAAMLFAERFGVWVDGRDASPRLARKAAEAARAAGLGRKAAVICETDGVGIPPLRRGFYDAAYLRDLLFRTADKDALLNRLDRALVARGELLAIDFVRPDAAPDPVARPAFDRWRAAERPLPQPWSVSDWRAAAMARGWELRLCQDITMHYRNAVLRDLTRYVGTLRRGMLGRPEAEALIAEVEMWARRLATFDEGSLRAYRLFAITAFPASATTEPLLDRTTSLP